MELPDDTPRLAKLPFLVGDLILLSVAALLAYRMGADPTTAEVVGVVVATGLAVAVGLAPFVVGYARQQEQLLQERERLLENIVRRTATASDQASIAAHGLHEIAEKTKANLDRLDDLPVKLQAAREAAMVETSHAENKALENLQDEMTLFRSELRANIDALTTRLEGAVAAIENSVQASVPAAPSTEAEPAAPTDSDKGKTRRKRSPPAPEVATDESWFGGDIVSNDQAEAGIAPAKPAPKRKKKPSPAAEAPAAETEAATTNDAALAPEPEAVPETEKPVEPPPPDTPAKTADPSPPDPVIEAEDSDDDLPIEIETAPAQARAEDEVDEPVEPLPAEPAVSADGMTRLTVTAYIGIGNRLFLRGEGPGLSPDEGVPLQFVSIGKWRWETDEATAPVKVTLWKNDEQKCTAVGEIELQPGAQLETSANF